MKSTKRQFTTIITIMAMMHFTARIMIMETKMTIQITPR